MTDPNKTPEITAETTETAEITCPITTKLAEIGVAEDKLGDIAKALANLGVTEPSDIAILDKDDLREAGLNPVQIGKLLKPTPAPETTPTVIPTASFDSILPKVPDDGALLTMLISGGILKADVSTVIAAVRAALANRFGLYDIPEKLVAEMEAFADSNDDPVGPSYFSLRKQLVRNDYGDLFSAIDGLDGNYVTKARKAELFRRIDAKLWAALSNSYFQLKAWQESWMQGAGNPMIMMANFMAGGGATLPPGMMAPPDTGSLRDAGDDINNALNHIFAGTGTVTASALAYRSGEIRKILSDSTLPSMIGAANPEQMFKKLNITVSASSARQENNIVQYILGFIQAKDIADGDEAVRYFSALFMLGSQIDWRQLGINIGDSSGSLRVGQL
ncbi:hypothetical protein FWD07_01110 [Candidatus Saccharibacteria bacterium]|nr:hypothetical protein [Candidatus Saccharibacteria bacterium]